MTPLTDWLLVDCGRLESKDIVVVGLASPVRSVFALMFVVDIEFEVFLFSLLGSL